MHTILRDVNTNRDDFIFYAERLSTLIIEKYVSVQKKRSCIAFIPTHVYLKLGDFLSFHSTM